MIPSLALGGAERQLSYLGPELVRMGHDVHVAFLHPGPNLHRLDSGGVVLHQFEANRNHDPGILLGAIRIIREIDPDVVQTWLLQMDIVGALATAATGKPWILTERSSALGHPAGVKNRIRWFFGGKADAIVSNSRGGDMYWQSRRTPRRRIVIPNSLPLDEIEETSPDSLTDFVLDRSMKVVLFVGRLTEGKNIPNLIAALAEVMAGDRIAALFCGNGPMKSQAEKQVEQLSISDRVFFLGNTQRAWALMKRADLFAFISEFEGFSNVVIEAMACGCPLLVSDIPSHREFLDEETAIFVDPHRSSDIADAIQRFFSMPDKAELRARAAKKRVEKWSNASMAGQYEKLYREILDD